MKCMSANRKAPNGTILGLFCLPMSHKKDARLIWVTQSDAFSSKVKCMPLFAPLQGHKYNCSGSHHSASHTLQ